MQGLDHLLVIRLSSLGDVAMTVPVLRLLIEQHPSLQVTMVSQKWMKPLFAGIPRLQFHGVELKSTHKGLKGLYRLYRELQRIPYSAIADLHNVLRTKILRSLFSFSGAQLSVIDKGRKEKRELTRSNNKILRQLPSTFDRYAKCFSDLGFPIRMEQDILSKRVKRQREVIIGLAPVAQYAEKTYPLSHMKEVIILLMRHDEISIQLFGGKTETSLFREWEQQWPRVVSMAGKFELGTELTAISQLDLMVSMDSANMHLAAMQGVPVVSVWGGTHPYLGFAGWNNDPQNFVQMELDCRPSSVYGNKSCRNQCACMKQIPPQLVYEKILRVIDKSSA